MARHIPRVYCPSLSRDLETFDVPDFERVRLISVLRLREGDNFLAFNEISGEWLSAILSIGRDRLIAKRVSLKRDSNKDHVRLALAFCLIKPDNVKLIIEKGTELGVTEFFPLMSQYTNSKINLKKLDVIAILASEQSERLDIPKIHSLISIEDFLLKNVPQHFNWISAIERRNGEIQRLTDLDLSNRDIGFIIGPEGGFTEREKEELVKVTIPVSISKNILRAETAAIACLSVCNAQNS